MLLSNHTSARSKGKRKTTRKTTSRKRTTRPKGKGGAARSRSAQREWKKRGTKTRRLSPLSSFLPILERRENKQHVVSYDPQEIESDGAPTRRAARRSSRGRQTPTARGKRTVREADEDLEEVQTTSRRRPMRGSSLQEEPDKIQIEVGSVKALSTKYGIVRGMTWMVLLSMLLWWVPVLGPATVGYVGGRKSGGPFRAAVAALVPLLFVFGVVAVTTSSAENVPLTIQHYISQGYNAVLGSLPFDFPLLSYIFTNLGAVMTSGPDVLFTVLAFALVGGAVTQMRIHERSVPPITARLPKHRMVQGPARSYESANEALETLVARLAAVVERAERRGGSLGGASAGAPDGRTHQRRGWSSPFPSFGRHNGPAEYPSLAASASPRGGRDEAPAAMDGPSRQVVSAILASTAPQAKGRAAKQAVRAARPVELDIPQALAYSDEPGAATVAPLGTAHVYRPSKLYHIYGGTVNPVARKKLEKRLRRTHTLHSMRQSAHALVKQPDALPRSERGRLAEVDDLVDDDPDKPRSLERSAIGSSMQYDLLEHLENATVAPPPAKHPKVHKPKELKPSKSTDDDELGGLIAHLGEGGEAVVDEAAVRDVEFTDGPVFDRRGRQRARIAPDDKPMVQKAPTPLTGKTQVAATESPAQARKRREDAAAEKARVDKWLAHTLSDVSDAPAKKKAPKVTSTFEPLVPEPEVAHEAEAPAVEEAPRKRREAPAHATGAGPKFEITHGSVEADAEADSDEEESAGPASGKRNRTAAQILKEIRQQKKDDQARKEQADAARRARDAKAAADEIERRIREAGVDEDGGGETHEGTPPGDDDHTLVTAGGQTVALQAAPKARRHRSDDLEAVMTTAEELSGELELTLDPVREEAATEREAHAAVANLPMLDPEDPAEAEVPAVEAPVPEPEAGDASAGGEITPGSAVPQAAAQATKEDAEPVRDVDPEDVVLAGPSTDTPGFDPEEAELSDNDREKIKKRLQEGWNRL